MAVSPEDQKVLVYSQRGELEAVLMYNALADVVKDPHDAEVFRQLAKEEGGHAAVFKKLSNEIVAPRKTLAIFMPIMYKILGKKRLYPLIAKGEYDAAKKYEPVVDKFAEVRSVMQDEIRHGDTVKELL